jgi:hypothetical protein
MIERGGDNGRARRGGAVSRRVERLYFPVNTGKSSILATTEPV